MTAPFDSKTLITPCYVIDEEQLRYNLHILSELKQVTGCKILLAQKAFSMFACYPLIAQYLDGATASGLYEAKLAQQHFDGEKHIFSTAYRDEEMTEILDICDHLSFNSPTQWQRFRTQVLDRKSIV